MRLLHERKARGENAILRRFKTLTIPHLVRCNILREVMPYILDLQNIHETYARRNLIKAKLEQLLKIRINPSRMNTIIACVAIIQNDGVSARCD